jgi:hypothetical protein
MKRRSGSTSSPRPSLANSSVTQAGIPDSVATRAGSSSSGSGDGTSSKCSSSVPSWLIARRRQRQALSPSPDLRIRFIARLRIGHHWKFPFCSFRTLRTLCAGRFRRSKWIIDVHCETYNMGGVRKRDCGGYISKPK